MTAITRKDYSVLPLYTLLVEENFGIGQLVSYFFIHHEDTTESEYFCISEHNISGLEIFKLVIIKLENDVNI